MLIYRRRGRFLFLETERFKSKSESPVSVDPMVSPSTVLNLILSPDSQTL